MHVYNPMQCISHEDITRGDFRLHSNHGWSVEFGDLARYALFLPSASTTISSRPVMNFARTDYRAGVYLTEFRHAPHSRKIVATIL